MKKVIAFISAAVMFCGCAVSCADKKKNSSVTELSTNLLQLKTAKISMSDSFEEIRSLSTGSGSDVLIFGKLTTGGWGAYVTNNKFDEHKDIRFTPKDGEIVQSAAMLSYGKKGILTLLDGKALIYIYDKDNKYEKTIDCGDILEVEENYFGRLYGYGDDGFIINIMNRRIIAVASDGTLRGDIKTDGMDISGVAKSASGVMNIMLYDKKEIHIDEINADELSTVQKCTYNNNILSSAYCMGAGSGKYNSVAVMAGGIYGFTDTEVVKLAKFMDMEFEEYQLREIFMTAENEMVVLTDTGELYLLSEKDISEIKAKEVIVMASYSQQSDNGLYAREVKAFNAASEDYRIEFKQYFRLLDGYEKTYDDMRMDILSGNAPDIIPLNSNLPVDTFNTGIFCDLYEFIDKDPDFSRDDFLPNIRRGLERNGKMVWLAPQFWFESVPAKAGYTGVRENWSVDDMISAYDAMPDGMTFYQYEDVEPRTAFYDFTVKSTLFVDYEKAECYFDSPEYIKLLNFFNDKHIGLTWDEYNSLSGDRGVYYMTNDIYEGKRFVDFNHNPFTHFGQFLELKRGDYDDQLVMVGYPHIGNESGSFIHMEGGLAIMADSEHKDGAWSFMRTLISDDYYDAPDQYREYSVIKRKFNEFAEMTLHKTYPFWAVGDNGKIAEGKMVDQEWGWSYTDAKGKTVKKKIAPFTQEEYDYYYNLVTNAEVVRGDSNIDSIIREETMSLFNEECTAEECAKKIQNRASLYLSEHYG